MLSLVFLISAMAGEPANSPVDEFQQALNVLTQLDAARLSMDYHDEPLEQVLVDLNAHLPMTVRADWATLRRLGVDADDRTTLRISAGGTAALSALSLTLGDEFERPVFEVHAGQMVLTTVQGTEAMRLTAVYDVRDLLADAALFQRLRDEVPPMEEEKPAAPKESEPATQPQPDPVPARWPQAFPPHGRPRHTILTDAAPAEQVVKDNPIAGREQTPGEQLINLITDHVDPEAWMNFGGSRAKVTDQNGVLLVTATPTTHRKLIRALEQLRDASSSSIHVKAAIVDVPRSRWDSLQRQYDLHSAALAMAVRDDSAAVIVWTSSAPSTIDHPLTIESQASDVTVRCVVTPRLDAQTRQISAEVDASTSQAGDRRSVKTIVSFPGDVRAAILELPAPKPGATVRFIVLSIDRG